MGSVAETDAAAARPSLAATEGLADPPAVKREMATGNVQLD